MKAERNMQLLLYGMRRIARRCPLPECLADIKGKFCQRDGDCGQQIAKRTLKEIHDDNELR